MLNHSTQTNNSLTVFNFKNQEVRTVVVDGEFYWVAADVCKVLSHSDTEVALRRLDDDEKLIRTVYGSGQGRNMWCVTESGLYHLIFTSRKEEAKIFRRWVTEEVLPSIRKTGFYADPNDLFGIVGFAHKIVGVFTSPAILHDVHKAKLAHVAIDKLCKIFYRARRDLEGILVLLHKENRFEIRKSDVAQLQLFED
jgi:BRO family, N-terminal domain